MTSDDQAVLKLLRNQPGAQPLGDALENIRRRRERLLAGSAPNRAPNADIDPAAPERVPLIDAPDDFGEGFWERRQAKRKPKAPKGKPTKAPHLTVHDGKDTPAKK